MMTPVKKRFRSSSSEENKKMKSQIMMRLKLFDRNLCLIFIKSTRGDLDRKEATFRDKRRCVTYWGSLQRLMRHVADDEACRCRQLVTSRVGLSPILGNPGSWITGLAKNIGGRSSLGRSMSSGGGLSIPFLTSRLNLNTNSGPRFKIPASVLMPIARILANSARFTNWNEMATNFDVESHETMEKPLYREPRGVENCRNDANEARLQYLKDLAIELKATNKAGYLGASRVQPVQRPSWIPPQPPPVEAATAIMQPKKSPYEKEQQVMITSWRVQQS
ncbi:hypothetical protein Tco_1335979 [Tanacetum coccineum]